MKLQDKIRPSIFFAAVFSAILCTAYLVYAVNVHANPSRIPMPVSCSTQGTSATSLATTSYTSMPAGTATTTATCDLTKIGYGTESADGAVLYIELTASSTNTALLTRLEYSNDGVDWYADTLLEERSIATTSTIFNLSTAITYPWTFASSTIGGGAPLPSNNRDRRVMSVPTPSRYVRAVFSTSGGNGYVWATFGPKSQIIER